MKKVLLAVAFALVGMIAQAAYLNWQVSSGDYTETFNSAALYAANGSSIVNLSGIIEVPGAASTSIEDYTDGSWHFFIELINYDNSTYTRVARSETFAYADDAVQNALSNSLLDSAQAMATALSGTAYSAVPEPTTGLLTLLGVALLGLKRRKVA